MKKHIVCTVLCFSYLLLIFLRFIYIIVCIDSSFLYPISILLNATLCLCTHFSLDRHMGYLPFGDMNKSVVDMLTQFFVWTDISISLWFT